VRQPVQLNNPTTFVTLRASSTISIVTLFSTPGLINTLHAIAGAGSGAATRAISALIQAMHAHKAGVRCILAAGSILFISGELGEGVGS
jgi:hypothetical protein